MCIFNVTYPSTAYITNIALLVAKLLYKSLCVAALNSQSTKNGTLSSANIVSLNVWIIILNLLTIIGLDRPCLLLKDFLWLTRIGDLAEASAAIYLWSLVEFCFAASKMYLSPAKQQKVTEVFNDNHIKTFVNTSSIANTNLLVGFIIRLFFRDPPLTILFPSSVNSFG